MMINLLETKRTFLRPITIEDAEDFYALNLNPQVLRYTGDTPFETIEDARQFIANYEQYTKFGVGRLAVIEKETNLFLGWCGLKYKVDSDEYDIGFRFNQTHWNKGFATETAKKCLEFGFIQLNLPQIIGRAMKENIGSIKVFEKIGMAFQKTIDFEEHEGLLYCLTKNDYETKHLNLR